ncbi:MAG: 50S ribosomal protein L11 methyltransferase [Chloroflexi bacterium]|nr:50S ribosomal protein L11 methyltransferase [Chloroflexota bacterium]
MKWLEICVDIDNEIAEAVAEVFSRYAYKRGVVIEAGPAGWNAGSVSVKAYLPIDDSLPQKQRALEEALWHLSQIAPIPTPVIRSIAELDWSEAWKQHMTVMRIGQHIIIRPSWLDYQPMAGDVVIELDPGMAFGTGLHPTTQMCLEALERHIHRGDAVLDLGTGTGILSIAAAKLGASTVLALDNDPIAVEVARSNVLANDSQTTVTVGEGSLTDVTQSYNIILVNILAQVILDMLDQGLGQRLASGGIIATTGILDSQADDIIHALQRAGLELVNRDQINDWICLVARR